MFLKLSRRRALQALGAIGAPEILPSIARAQALPDKPVTILVGFVAGGGSDHLARTVAPRLENRIGRHVKVENHAGNNGALVGDSLRKGPPDGSIIGCIPSYTIAARAVDNSYTFDPRTDFTPLSLGGTFPLALALSPLIGIATVAQYIDWLKGSDKSPPGDKTRTRIGMAAADVYLDVYVRLLGKEFGTPLQAVAYRGDQPLLNDIRDNKIPAGIITMPSALEYHRGGKVKIVLTSSDKRLAYAPGLQTAFEVGHPSLVMTEWYGLFAAAHTPASIADLWNMHIRAVLAEPETAAELSITGMVVQSSTREELGERVTTSMQQWKDRMVALGMQPPG
jgi:tripartite-type tricarboxylate transporter receptor subunit TctC